MKEKMSLLKKKMIYSLITMSSIFCLLVFCILLLPSNSFSWLSKNEKVDGSGSGSSVEKSPLRVEYARCDAQTLGAGEFTQIHRDASLDFLESDVWYPGYFVVFELKITNVGIETICVDTVGFCAPMEEEEIALVLDEKSYYLGTQLSASVLAINQVPQVPLIEQRLLTLAPNGVANRAELVLYEDENQSIVLEPSESIQLTIRLSFVNEDFSQDEYRNFGKTEDAQECCRRRLFVNYAVIE